MKKLLILLIPFLLIGCAGMSEKRPFRDINNIRIGMSKTEVITTLGLKKAPYGSRSFYTNTSYEHWRICWDWLNHFHECIGYGQNEVRFMFESGKLVNISD